ncbi:hypothetical protein cce_4373 [Crocosphaera subtropica ATCC 51142]|uniref:DUF5615 domain-containing protein n=1 Tax=Crocosphaera subtropica (strain ATCC 51142 / BH68) TaxID=43989 RepID=B1WTK6_CROS5|nr:hypothetical protein cce_4373 [Crocosphaera subtropica ATCC 51142]
MKFLFDENLSPKLPTILAVHFPNSIKEQINRFNNHPSESILIIS